MTREDRAVLEGILEAQAANQPCALATVIATQGSTPRKNGAKMLVNPEGLIGTVGGGCGEAQVIEAAHEAMDSGLPRIVQIDLTDDPMAWTGSVCGGILRVFVEPVLPQDS
jgi:xanthine dehydrogenase accessory factor